MHTCTFTVTTMTCLVCIIGFNAVVVSVTKGSSEIGICDIQGKNQTPACIA